MVKINTQKRKNHKKKYTFKKKDFISSEGMLTNIWGPNAWHLLHTISFNYPVNPTYKDKMNYRKFVLSLKDTLPCKYCRINLKNNLKKKPLTIKELENRDTFSRYIYELHEIINNMLNKSHKLSYNEVRERYENFRARCTQENNKIFNFNKIDKKESGCIEPLYGKKSKCIIKIVPEENKEKTFQIEKECIKKRIKT